MHVIYMYFKKFKFNVVRLFRVAIFGGHHV